MTSTYGLGTCLCQRVTSASWRRRCMQPALFSNTGMLDASFDVGRLDAEGCRRPSGEPAAIGVDVQRQAAPRRLIAVPRNLRRRGQKVPIDVESGQGGMRHCASLGRACEPPEIPPARVVSLHLRS